jgi:pimeloyl-ACP methyl ester carboxylesterase
MGGVSCPARCGWPAATCRSPLQDAVRRSIVERPASPAYFRDAMRHLTIACTFAIVGFLCHGSVQGSQPRSMAQDPALDNLKHPSGTVTLAEGTLGNVRKHGTGPRAMLLVPGLGFGDSIWTEFMERHAADYTMFAITLPGFGGTNPLPMPASNAAFADLAWTRSTLAAIDALIERERLARVTVVAHWSHATQIALRLALERPDRIEAVILIGGVLRSYFDAIPNMASWTLDERVRNTEMLGQRWFKTVTRKTWDDNNFMPWDYAVNPRRGLSLWREAQSPTLPVWIRYLLEFYAMDLSSRLKDLRVRTLVVQPGFDDPGMYVEPNLNYMRNLCQDSWRGVAASDTIQFVTIPGSRLFVMYDKPEELDREIARFLR